MRVAREAARERRTPGAGGRVGGSGGHGAAAPPGVPAERAAAVTAQVRALLEAGVDLLVLETFGYLDELVEAAGVALDAAGPGGPAVLAQATFAADGRTLGGDSPAEVCAALAGLPITVIGTNCTLGPQGVLAVVQQLREHTDLPIDRPAQRRAAPAQQRATGFSYGVDASTSPAMRSCSRRRGGRGRWLLRHHPGAPRGGGPGRRGPPTGAGPGRAAGRVRRPSAATPRGRRGWRVLAEIEPPQAGHVAAALERAEAIRDRGVQHAADRAPAGGRGPSWDR